MGNHIVTETFHHSRNNHCGELIGLGVPPVEAIKQIGMVVEVIYATPVAPQHASSTGCTCRSLTR